MNAKRLRSWGAGIGLLLTIVGLFWLTAANVSAQAATPAATRTPRATATRTVTATETLTATEEMTGTEEVTATAAATLTGDALLAQEIDAMLAEMAADGEFSGSVLIARDGVPILNEGYGLASIEWEVPNTPDTKFSIGTITRPFTALAILQLQEQGLLDVQDSVCEHIDPCPEAWEAVTIHHLLTDRSGIPEYSNHPDHDNLKRNPASPEQLLDRVRDLPLDYAPGEQPGWTNTSYVILGQIVENLGETSFARYLKQQILDPAGMKNSGLDSKWLILPKRAAGYQNSQMVADYLDPSAAYTSGGMYATTEDLLRWDQALYSDTLLSQESLDAMFAPQTDVIDWLAPDELAAGYGWFVAPDGRVAIAPSRYIGFAGQLRRFPEEKVTIILLSNLQDLDYHGLATTLENMIFARE